MTGGAKMFLPGLGLLILLSASGDEPCHFDEPISIVTLKEATKTCYLEEGTTIRVWIEDVDPPQPKPGIGFHSNDSSLTDNSKQTLDGISAILSTRKKMIIKIVGYADSNEQGDLLDLSLRRAQAASAYLTEKGIDPTRIHVEAAGAEAPVDVSGSTEGRARNRRVEFVVSAP